MALLWLQQGMRLEKRRLLRWPMIVHCATHKHKAEERTIVESTTAAALFEVTGRWLIRGPPSWRKWSRMWNSQNGRLGHLHRGWDQATWTRAAAVHLPHLGACRPLGDKWATLTLPTLPRTLRSWTA